MSIKENVERRKRVSIEVNEIVSLIEEWMSDDEDAYSEIDKKLFWDLLLDQIPTRFKPQADREIVRSRPMSDDEARQYGNRKLGFGKHGDDRINDVPREYLLWLDEQNEAMSRYLASDYFQREDR